MTRMLHSPRTPHAPAPGCRSPLVAVGAARWVTPLLAWVVAVACWSAPAAAQSQVQAPDLWLVPDTGGVVVQLPTVPVLYRGIHVYRSEAGGDLERLTTEPITPLRDPGAIVAALGEAVLLIQDVTRATTPAQMTRIIQQDRATASVYSMLFPSVAEALGRRYRDTTAVPGATYTYEVALVDLQLEETGERVAGTVTVEPTLPPSPGELAGEPDQGTARLRWSYPTYTGDPDDVVVGFNVYRATNDEGPYQRVNAAPIPRDDSRPKGYADQGLLDGRRYVYRVRAVDLLGREGPVSPAVEVVIGDVLPPAAPEAVGTEPGDGVATVVWRISPEPDLAGYYLERSLGLDQPYARITGDLLPRDEPVWVDSTVVGGTRYFYRVVAVDSAGRESRPSNASPAVPYDVTPPGPPGPVSGTAVDRRLSLVWTASGGADVLGYYVYRGETAETLTRVTVDPVRDTAFTDRGFDEGGLVPGGSYVVRVTAVDRSFNESTPVETVITVPDDLPPGPPTGLRTSNPHGRAVRLSWNAAPDLDVVGYRVLRTDTAIGTTVIVDSATLRLESVDGDVQPGATYRYSVMAVDGAGNEGQPAESEITFRDGSPPPRPNFVQAAPVDGGIRVEWERVAASDLAGYRVYRADLPTGRFEAVSSLVPPGTDLVFVDPEGTREHHYRVVAVDTSGNESEPSRPVRGGGS